MNFHEFRYHCSVVFFVRNDRHSIISQIYLDIFLLAGFIHFPRIDIFQCYPSLRNSQDRIDSIKASLIHPYTHTYEVLLFPQSGQLFITAVACERRAAEGRPQQITVVLGGRPKAAFAASRQILVPPFSNSTAAALRADSRRFFFAKLVVISCKYFLAPPLAGLHFPKEYD